MSAFANNRLLICTSVKPKVAAREQAKAAELAPYIQAALARKQVMPALADDEIPIVRASVKKLQINQNAAE